MKMTKFSNCLIATTFIIKCCCVFSQQPNFIIVLTDDQDLLLGGMVPLKKTYSILGQNGAEFTNMFVTTPLCCPSRASILTGKYAHHHKVRNNSISGNCNSKLWQQSHEPSTFVTHLKKAGYTTLYAGKYLNQYGKNSVGGTKHIPPGWDQWIALVGNSQYYNYSLSKNGKKVDHGSDPQKDYLTNVVFSEAVDFVSRQNRKSPFFMFLSPPSPHVPFTAAPEYSEMFPNLTAPRTPNFAFYAGKDKHWLLRQAPTSFPKHVIQSIDEVYRNRWRTLLSVDDGIFKLYLMLNKKGFLDNTYIFFTSDNGFHLGQFMLPWDKRQLYEFDIRVPLLVKGPGIQGLQINHTVLNIDLAPTILELANLVVPLDYDGESFAPLLKLSKRKYLARSSFIVEHQGEATDDAVAGCPKYKPHEVHTCEIDCICEDSQNNTYTCVRRLSAAENSITCHFKDDENFIEVYDLTNDPFQLKNLFINKL